MAELVPPPHRRRVRCLGLGDPDVVAAVARGGGLGVLDGADPDALRVVAARVRVPYGVRTDGPLPEGAAFAIRTRAPWAGALAEVTDLATASEAVANGALGLVARGGELSEFVLLQQLLNAFDVPVWACPAGPRTAVGALAGGAVGAYLANLSTSDAEKTTRRIVGAEIPEAWLSERLCRTLGSELPVVQGPMTRVSDQPGFAAAVAEAGGFPFVAVATANGARTAELLTRTAERLGDRPWGAGILGFVADDLRAEQLAAIRAVRPRCVLVAGGKPGQAKALEAEGIATFLHVPSPILLRQYLDAGVRRFVFEGAECGGHIGPRSSFELWEEQLDVLGAAKDVEVLFAGGIHDARSATMVTAMAAPLDGAGVLMGTAYLFTEEAVAHGAITGLFQDRALAADTTVTLETAPGHRTRCLPSPYTAEFEQVKAGLADVPPQEAWQRLEELNTGRLRVASKGVRRDGTPLSDETQLAEGMYLAGQVAVLRDRRTTIAELHREVTSATNFVQDIGNEPETSTSDIAIVGIACTFPGAPDLAAYWSNILRGEDAVTEVPKERWDPDVYFGQSASKWGGFLPPVPVDPLDFGIPPAAMGAIDPAQLVSLETARRALADAGYAERAFDRERTSVVFGAEAGGDLANAGTLRSLLDGYLDGVPAELLAQLPEPTEDTFPGTLANVISGRIANRLDLGGANYTVDAACGSSLAALDLATKELCAGTSEMVLCGAVDLHNGIHDYLMFTSAGALSPTGRCRPFDAAADGIALGEGVACLVLKRLADAERDGDRVYAVIKGVGAASDGKALGLTAPRPEGQRRALERAYRDAGVSPVDVGLVEAHGTGTVVGDATELRTLTEFFTESGAEAGSCVLGSVKSQIGHTKCAAGLAGLIKAALALWHEVVPPTRQLKRPNAAWDATSPFTFTTAARPWPKPARFAGVSAFGFGGTNFHAVLGRAPVAPDRRHGYRDWPADVEETVAKIRPSDADPGKVAFLFPGQGSQRPGMLAELFVAFPELADVLRLAPDIAEIVFPPTAFGEESAQEEALTDTQVAQPALGLVETAVARLLAQVGVRPDVLAGHSYGELVALSVAGAFDTGTLLRLSRARARAIADVAAPGTMAAVKALRDVLTPTLIGPDVVVANHNAPDQVVLSGPMPAVERAIRRLRERGIAAKRIPVACAFHSPLVAPAGDVFAAHLADESIVDTQFPVWANRTARPYAGDIREELAAQIGSPVRFAEQIEDMYAAGVRTFVEAGPGRVLTRLVQAILGDRPHTVVACGPDLRGFVTALARLAEAGVAVDTTRLTRGRERPEPPPKAWAVDGRSARAPGSETPALPPARRIRSQPMNQPAPGRDQVVADFLRTTRELVAAQREVVLGYLGTAPVTPVVVEAAPVAAVQSAPEPQPEPQPEPERAEPVDVLARVIGVISDRTGYPAEMIAGDLDLEADLSIDSIKRTEIAGTLLAELGLAADDRTDQLSRDRTADALAAHLESWLAPLVAAPRRYVPARVAVPLDPDPGRVRGKSVAVVHEPGQEDLAETVRAAFARAGAEPAAGDADITVSLTALAEADEPVAPRIFALLKEVRGTVLVAAKPSSVGAAGLRGLLRAAALERDSVTRLVEATEDIAKVLLDEALSGGPAVVRHDAEGRSTIEPRAEDLGSIAYSGAGPGGGELAALGLGPESVVLLLGGARGITARAAVALAASGCRVELAGRTPWPAEPDDLPEDATAMRAVLAGRGGTVAEIERRVRTVLAQREIGRTLAEIRASGGDPAYRTLDVRDAAAVHQLVKDLHTRHGRLDGVVFAAGVIDDKLMADKDETSFRAVFGTKVDGARALLDALAEFGLEPGFVAFFGSIAAVLGNRGQTDYAAANDALETLGEHWPGRAVTVHWGPWAPAEDHGGMVSPELAREYERREVGLLDPAEGTAALLRELAYGSARSVLYTASLW